MGAADTQCCVFGLRAGVFSDASYARLSLRTIVQMDF